MITMDYKDAGAWGALFFAIAILLALIPVLWVGDLAIYLVNEINPNPTRFAYILAWLGTTSFYYFIVLEQFVAKKLLVILIEILIYLSIIFKDYSLNNTLFYQYQTSCFNSSNSCDSKNIWRIMEVVYGVISYFSKEERKTLFVPLFLIIVM